MCQRVKNRYISTLSVLNEVTVFHVFGEDAPLGCTNAGEGQSAPEKEGEEAGEERTVSETGAGEVEKEEAVEAEPLECVEEEETEA